MKNLVPYANSIWLCEPARLQQLAFKAASFPTCRTAKEVAKARRRELDGVDDLIANAINSTGNDVVIETLVGIEGGPQGQRYVQLTGMMNVDQKQKLKAEWDALHRGLECEPVKILAEAPRAIRAVKGKVGVIPVHGPVDQRMSSALEKVGGTSLEFVSAAFDAMMSNPSIGAIVFHMDSPGGGTYGTQELADKIYSARGMKPTYCMVDSMACSAAYWIGSACSMMVCTPGGDVGSVGVYAMHVDESAALEKDGIRVTMVSAGKFKTEYAPNMPLSDDAKANLQESVDATYGKFLSALARNRGTPVGNVRDNYGQGRVLNADKALAAGMIDRIMPFADLLAKLIGTADAAPGAMQRAASVEAMRLRVRAVQAGVSMTTHAPTLAERRKAIRDSRKKKVK